MSSFLRQVSRLKTASQSSDAPIKMVGVEWTPPRPSPIVRNSLLSLTNRFELLTSFCGQVFTKSIPPAGDDMEGVEYAPPTTVRASFHLSHTQNTWTNLYTCHQISHLIPSQSGGDNMEGIEYASAPAPVPVIPIVSSPFPSPPSLLGTHIYMHALYSVPFPPIQMPFAPVATQAAATAAQPAAPTQPQPVALPTRIFDLKDFDITRIFNVCSRSPLCWRAS